MLKLVVGSICLISIAMPIAVAIAFDGSKWASQDASTRDWFRNLHAPNGIPCCDYADGHRIEAPDYTELDDGSYDVRLPGGVVHVDKRHVVSGTNRIGYAVYWGVAGMTYCFMPGARG
jgi:hypothetical protein